VVIKADHGVGAFITGSGYMTFKGNCTGTAPETNQRLLEQFFRLHRPGNLPNRVVALRTLYLPDKTVCPVTYIGQDYSAQEHIVQGFGCMEKSCSPGRLIRGIVSTVA